MVNGCTSKEHGVTLIEVALTVAIIGILAAIGINQFQTALCGRELNRAAWELASDIRWMQQLSANDVTPRLSDKIPLEYRYRLKLGNASSDASDDATANYYQVLDNDIELKKINFNNDRVNAQIMVPKGLKAAEITYYAYDVDRLRSDNTLENSSYQVRLTHKVTKAVLYVNVDSRVGRVWINTDGASPF